VDCFQVKGWRSVIPNSNSIYFVGDCLFYYR
jgi:hypothetical protein